MLSAVGVPVYLHYCGGELEKINYVVKSDSCCDGEDGDPAMATNDCCKDENIVLKNSADFTLKQFNNYDAVKTFCNLFYIQLPFSDLSVQSIATSNIMPAEPAPPRLQNSQLISTSVLRI